MKYLLVNPLRYQKDSYIFPPVHLLYIAQAIRRAGGEATIVDLPYLLDTDHKRFSLDDDSGIEYVLAQEFDVLGIGSVVSSYFYAERLVDAVRRRRPDTPIIVGGSLGQPLLDVWQSGEGPDFICEADGELVMERFVRAFPHDIESVRAIPGLWARETDGSYTRTEAPELPMDLDYIPFVTYDEVEYEYFMENQRKWVRNVLSQGNYHFDPNARFLPLIMSRGCVYDCTFCFHFNRLHRRHSPKYIADNVEFMMEKYGATAFNLLDDLTIVNKKWLHAVCDEFIARGINKKVAFFSGGGKPSVVDREILEHMLEAGFQRLSFGIESGSPSILKVMNKGTTVEDNYSAIKMIKEVGMPYSVNIVFGMPGESKRTMNETRDFLISLDLNSRDYYAALATPYPGSPLFRQVQEMGLVGGTRDYLHNLGGYADYRINMTDMSRAAFINHVLDVEFRVDVAYWAKRKRWGKVASLLLQKYAKMVYHGLVPPDVRGKLKLTSRFNALLGRGQAAPADTHE